MARGATPFLMFEGRADEAMDRYVSLFDDGRVLGITRYGGDGPGPEGTVQQASFELAGQRFRCSDSYVSHGFGFTPSLSIWIEAESDDEIERLAAGLAEGGSELMPLGAYGFSRRFAWVQDRFGVSWQLNLAEG